MYGGIAVNLPNALSLLRLAMVPVFPIVYFHLGGQWALCVYALASATDILDGYLARKYDMITKLGRFLDPLADKLMSACVLVCLTITYPVLLWASVTFVLKETCMGVGALIQYKKIYDVPPSTVFGKFSALYFFGACAAILLFPDLSDTLRTVLVASAIVVTLAALALYLARYIRMMREASAGQKDNKK